MPIPFLRDLRLRATLRILNRAERKQLFALLSAMVVTSVMQIGGVGSVVPFLTILGTYRLLHKNRILEALYTGMGFTKDIHFLFFLGVLVLIAVVVSNVAAALTEALMVRYSRDRQHRLSVRLLERYLTKSYVELSLTNPADLAKNVLNEAVTLSQGVIHAQLKVVAHSMRALALVALLLWLNPLLAVLAMSTMGGAYALLYRQARRKLKSAGEDRARAMGERFRVINEAFGGLKELKIFGRERTYLDRFAEPSLAFTDAEARFQNAALIPRYAVELVAFAGIVLIVLFLSSTRGDLRLIVPLASAYTFAAYRVRPSLQAVFEGLSSIRYNGPALDAIAGDLEPNASDAFHERSRERLPFEHSIALRGVTFNYPARPTAGVFDVSIEIQKGSSVGLVGATGSGKTTVIDVVAGLLTPSTGAMLVDGQALIAGQVPQWQNRIGYVPQHVHLSDASILANIALGVPESQIDRAAVERASRIANLHGFVTRELAGGYDSIVGDRGVRLSGGQRQRIGLARALYHDPDILLLDEATSALDGETEELVYRAIEQLKAIKTVLIVAHRLSTVRNCEVIHVLEAGRIVASGTYGTLLQQSERFRAMAHVAN